MTMRVSESVYEHGDRLNADAEYRSWWEAGYLVSRGVRPLALCGTVLAEPRAMLDAYNELLYMRFGAAQGVEPIALVVERSDGSCADVGWAASGWVADTFRWVSENAP